jgi:hypothetical protein
MTAKKIWHLPSWMSCVLCAAEIAVLFSFRIFFSLTASDCFQTTACKATFALLLILSAQQFRDGSQNRCSVVNSIRGTTSDYMDKLIINKQINFFSIDKLYKIFIKLGTKSILKKRQCLPRVTLVKEVLRRENQGLKVYPVDGSDVFSMTGTYF